MLVVDGNGAYRGSQEYRVDNKTEQFLEILVPEGAELWTVKVANESVKPTIVPGANNKRQVRVPLIKTQTGDNDYPVVLKYGGDLGRLRSFESINFPLIKTTNVNVELSHVYLRLPETHRWNWRPRAFGGTMRHVEDRGELAADYLSYQTKQVEQLLKVLASDRYDPFAKVRARKSVNDLRLGLSTHNREAYRDVTNYRLQKELSMNTAVLEQARQQVQDQQVADVPDALGNGVILQRRFRGQKNNPSRNVVNVLDNNFDSSGQDGQRIAGEALNFNSKWFSQNRLSNDTGEKPAENNRVQSLAKKKALVSGKPDSQLKESFGLLNAEAKREKAQTPERDGEDSQRRGELRQQVELYEQQLENKDLTTRQPRFAYPVPGAMTESQPALPQSAEGIPSAQTIDGVVGGLAQAPGQGQAGGMGGGGFGGGGAAASDFSDELTAQIDSVQIQSVVTGLTSLDVDLPQRGREYFFTTPRGDIEVTAQPIKSSQLNRATGLLIVLAALFAAWILWRAARLLFTRFHGKPLATLLVILGCFSLCSGTLPVLGILAIASGIWIFVRSFTAGTSAPAAA